MLPRFSVNPSVDSWFAVIPAGMEIMIAMEKPKAIITNSALILRLEIFLTALVTIPSFIHLQNAPEKEDNQKERTERGVPVLVSNVFGSDLVTMFFAVVAILLFGCLFLLKG